MQAHVCDLLHPSFMQLLKTQLPQPPVAAPGSVIDVQLFPQAGRTPLSETPCHPNKPTLHILRWNADGLSTKVQELRDSMAAEIIDVCLIQETKLTEKDAPPPFPDYNPIRVGRPTTYREDVFSPWFKKA